MKSKKTLRKKTLVQGLFEGIEHKEISHKPQSNNSSVSVIKEPENL